MNAVGWGRSNSLDLPAADKRWLRSSEDPAVEHDKWYVWFSYLVRICVFACCGALCVPANWSMTLECLHTICYNTFLFHSVWLELYSVLSWWFSCWPAVVVNVDVTIKKSWAPTEKSSSLSFRIWYAVILCVLHVWLWYRHFFCFCFCSVTVTGMV